MNFLFSANACDLSYHLLLNENSRFVKSTLKFEIIFTETSPAEKISQKKCHRKKKFENNSFDKIA